MSERRVRLDVAHGGHLLELTVSYGEWPPRCEFVVGLGNFFVFSEVRYPNGMPCRDYRLACSALMGFNVYDTE